ncbi:MAG: xanthine dehydrogenase family protein molybdopterin-binding subunit [Proteobacteria bacterium]|nr:xanthine dehydrogenase family protein molybdopterin-binding subunit [Pseudomonadota bacterium]
MDAHDGKSGIGAWVPRVEDQRLLTGAGCFSDDVDLPGQAYAALVRAPHAHARLRVVDTAAARAAPGVLAVLTGADLVADGIKPFPHAPAAQSPPDIKLVNTDGSATYVARHFPLAIERVRFVGEGVAMVIAETLAAAKDAAERIAIDYETLPAVVASRHAARADAPKLWDDAVSNVTLDAEVGDRAATDAAFARAAHVVTLETWVQRVTGVPMEPRAAVGVYDADEARYVLYAGGGGVVRPKRDLAEMLGVPEDRVRVIAREVGGNFGTRNSSYPEFLLVAWAARRVGRPVKWTCERSEAFLTDYQGRDLAVEAALALDRDGNFLALRASNLSNLGAYSLSFVPLTKGTELMSSLYRIPVVHARARAVFSNTAPTAPYRSAGRPEVMFVMERLIDRAAQAHGFDRAALRRRNVIPQSAMPYRNPFGMPYDSGHFDAVLERALALGEWDGFPGRRAEAAGRGRLRGIGVGAYIESASGAPHERAAVTVVPEGHIDVVIGTLSSGQGHETSFAQLITEWLGVAGERVRLITGDTDIVTAGGGSHSGRSMRHAGTTLFKASQEIIAKGVRIAAHLLEAADEDIRFADGRFTIAGTDHAVSLFEVAAAAETRKDLAEALRGPLAAAAEVVSKVSSFPHGWHVGEVEIDPETGEVVLARYTTVDDVGRAVNPLILHGQAHGGAAQGIGQALWEQCFYDTGTGELLSGSFLDYAMPRAGDLPMFTTALSEVPSTTHPLGFRGGGEGGITPALGVIVNAIVDALAEFGITHIEMPVTSERVWRALQAARAGVKTPT